MTRGLATAAPRHWRSTAVAVTLAGLLLALALTCSLTSSRWIGAPFPGFFVMANRVIASVSLPSWSVARFSLIYQHAVVEVNGEAAASSEALYDQVRRLPPYTPVTYTLQKDNVSSQVTLPTQIFTVQDYCLLFGAYLLSGMALAFIGIGVWLLKPTAPAGIALLLTGIAGGVFAITGADLYGPHWFFRVHVLAEALFPAGLIHLAFVFPVDWIRRRRLAVLSAPYLIGGALGAVYERSLYQPDVYSLIHNLSTIYGGVGGLALFGSVLWAYRTTESYLIRQKIRIVLAGFLGGFALPAILMLSSGLSGGDIAVNYAGFTTFLFPLSLGYAIVKHDLFEIDAMVRRGAYYLTLTAVLTLTYLGFLAILNFALRSADITHSPFFTLLFTLGVVLLLNPLRDHLQKGVDRVFFRLRYDPKKVLETTSAALASTLHLEEIFVTIDHTLRRTTNARGHVFLRVPKERGYTQVYPHSEFPLTLVDTHPLIRLLQGWKKRVLSLYDAASSEEAALSIEVHQAGLATLAQLGSQLLVPLTLKGEHIGFILLGPKASGVFFSADDIDFLSALANQSTLSIANALAYQEIQAFNVDLERKVQERTQALAETNTELHTSLERLEQAYHDLQRSQAQLLRAEKMADLGRLTAGIAHEMNTPLGAALTSLKLMRDLVDEYRSSIGDALVSERDHLAIAAEMEQLLDSTQQWMGKATAHIRSLKLHTRDLQPGEERLFSILQAVEDARLLLSHRLRLSLCTVVTSCPVEEPMLHGDPSKLGQVLTNLLSNAMDAYKDTGKEDRTIVVEINKEGDELEIRVRDQGCGIPPEHLEKIFDELYSTKPLGEGTGLGLPISRNIMTNFFGGSIQVESVVGQGSVFILRFPPRSRKEPEELSQQWTVQDHQHEMTL